MEVISLQNIISKKYNEIQRNFMCASAKINLKYDSDVFFDTYLKCCETLKDRKLTETNIIQYFWTAFANNSRKKYRKSKYKPDFIELSENQDTIEETYSDNKYCICDIINESIMKKFGDYSFKIWTLHFIENKSYEELTKMGYNNVNFHNLFRQINNYVKNKLPKENETYKILLKEAFI